jgi:hypothetical protein
MGVLQMGGDLDLAAEPVHAHAGRELGQEHLDHHLPAKRGLQRQEDAGHPPATELALDAVGIAKGLLELVPEVHGHGTNLHP